LAIAQDYFQGHFAEKSPSTSSDFDIEEAALAQLVLKYSHLNDLIRVSHLETIHLVKPLLDGKQICDLYGIKPGKAIKFLMEEELKFQI
jgi:hypothetical protein